MGKETQEWWKSVLKLAKDSQPRIAPSDTTWSANKFGPYYLQLISMTLARSQAESVAAWIGKGRPLTAVDQYYANQTADA